MRRHTYDLGQLAKLLRNLLDIKATFAGMGQQITVAPELRDPSETRAKTERAEPRRCLPFGMRPNDEFWPFFRERRKTARVMDGKKRGRSSEELLVAAIDIEIALKKRYRSGEYIVSDDDVDVLTKYYILQTHTLEELARERGMSNDRKGALRRVNRALHQLQKALDSKDETT